MTGTELVDRPVRVPSDAGDDALALTLARAAGDLLRCVRRTGLVHGKELGRTGDAIAQALLSRALSVHRPGDAVLSEEALDDGARLGASRVWVIDPLDGTREYSECRADWAVHVALTVDGVPTASAVALPALDRAFTSASPTPIPESGDRPLRVAVSRSRPPEQARRVADALQAELVPLGSAGYKTIAVLTGEVDAYVHAGGQYEWDSAAPVGVALASGLHASRLDGSPLAYNQLDPLLPDLVVCRPEIADRLLAALAGGASA